MTEEEKYSILNDLSIQKTILENTFAQENLDEYDEELLEQYQEELDIYKRTIDYINKQADEIEKLKKENEELKEKVFKRDKELIRLEEYANKNFERKDDVKAKYIPKDKIRELFEKYNINISEEEITADGLDALSFIEEIDELLEEE